MTSNDRLREALRWALERTQPKTHEETIEYCQRFFDAARALLDAPETVSECVTCLKCSRCVGACDCTGGPAVETECTCYEGPGHQPGCAFNRSRPPETAATPLAETVESLKRTSRAIVEHITAYAEGRPPETQGEVPPQGSGTVVCPTCKGDRFIGDVDRRRCRDCHGTGRLPSPAPGDWTGVGRVADYGTPISGDIPGVKIGVTPAQAPDHKLNPGGITCDEAPAGEPEVLPSIGALCDGCGDFLNCANCVDRLCGPAGAGAVPEAGDARHCYSRSPAALQGDRGAAGGAIGGALNNGDRKKLVGEMLHAARFENNAASREWMRAALAVVEKHLGKP